MKLINSVVLSLLTGTTFAFSQTTMCFKEKHDSIATIEDVKLDGGECDSMNSLKDMKNNGWKIEDIKITPKKDSYNFIYILKKQNDNTQTNFENYNSNITSNEIEARIIKKLENKREAEIKKIEIEKKLKSMSLAKELYVNKCSSCHGKNGEIEAMNVSRNISKLSLDELQKTMRDYTLDDYDRGRAIIMKPYADFVNPEDIKNIYYYLQSINNPEKVTK